MNKLEVRFIKQNAFQKETALKKVRWKNMLSKKDFKKFAFCKGLEVRVRNNFGDFYHSVERR